MLLQENYKPKLQVTKSTGFHIGNEHYQKCQIQCFQFEVDVESMPYLLKLINCESKARVSEQQSSH